MKKKFLIVLPVLVLAACGNGQKPSDNNDSIIADTAEIIIADTNENSSNVVNSEESEAAKKEEVMNHMIQVLQNANSRVEVLRNAKRPYVAYFVTDLNGDGYPELWICSQDEDDDKLVMGMYPFENEVFTLQPDGSVKNMMTENINHLSYGFLDGDLIGCSDTHGSWTYSKITYNGNKFKSQMISEGSDFNGDERPAKLERIKYSDWVKASNLQPLKNAFK